MHSISGKSEILARASGYLHDESKFQGGIPDELFFPETIKDVQDIVSRAAAYHKPITFIGARTGTTGGATCIDGCFAVAFSSMKQILEVKQTGSGSTVLACQPGVALATIQSFLKNPSTYPASVPGQEIIEQQHLFYPPDPTEATAQLGGTIAVNASGARSYRFGATRLHVHRLVFVNGCGDLITCTRGQYVMDKRGFNVQTVTGKLLTIPPLLYKNPLTKNAAGYFSEPGMDLLDLIIGSEGTLGAIVEIEILLQPEKEIISGLSFFPSRRASFDFANYLRSEKSIISVEYFDTSALGFVDRYRNRFPDWLPAFPEQASTAILWEWSDNDPTDFESAIDNFESNLNRCGSSTDKTWSGSDAMEQLLLKRFRHTLPEIINMTVAQNKLVHPEIRKIGTDTAVPAFCFEDVFARSISLIEQQEIPYAAFGHLGDYHIHINLLPSSMQQLHKTFENYDQLMELAIQCGGTVSAEHGIGKIKSKYLTRMYDTEAIRQMQTVKNALDPLGIFNPGNLL